MKNVIMINVKKLQKHQTFATWVLYSINILDGIYMLVMQLRTAVHKYYVLKTILPKSTIRTVYLSLYQVV